MTVENTPEARAQARQFLLDHMAFLTQARGAVPKGWRYNGTEAFLQAHGRFFEGDGTLPPGVNRGLPRLCFDTAYRETLRSHGRYHYVEGYAFWHIPTLHAWMVDQDGRVIDPTWESGLAYFGVELNLLEVKRSRQAHCTSLLDDWMRHFPAARGVPVIAKDAWHRREPTTPLDTRLPTESPHGIYGP